MGLNALVESMATDRGAAEIRVNPDKLNVTLIVRAPLAIEPVSVELGAYDFIAVAGAAIAHLGGLLAKAAAGAVQQLGRPT